MPAVRVVHVQYISSGGVLLREWAVFSIIQLLTQAVVISLPIAGKANKLVHKAN